MNEHSRSTVVSRPAPVIGGKYRLGREIGAGGMGRVHEAEHLALGETVALKLLNPSVAAFPEAEARFFREAKSLFRIDSEHVVRMLDVGTDTDGAPYLVMQLAVGEPLDALITRRGRLGVTESAELIAQTCEGLGDAHRIGIVHRDVKAQNVMVTTAVDGRAWVKLLDFGIAQLTEPGEEASRLTVAQAVIGTLSYMAPEQLRSSRDADPRSDVWSVGILLYELLTGKLPWSSTSPGDLVLRQHIEHVRKSAFGPEVPTELVDIVFRCLSMDPDARFEDANALADALAPFRGAIAASTLLEVSGIRSTPRPTGPRTPLDLRRRCELTFSREKVRDASGATAFVRHELVPRTSQVSRTDVSDARPLVDPVATPPTARLAILLVAAVGGVLVMLSTVLVLLATNGEPKAVPARLPPAAASSRSVAASASVDANADDLRSRPTVVSSATPPATVRQTSRRDTKPAASVTHAPGPAGTSIYTDKW